MRATASTRGAASGARATLLLAVLLFLIFQAVFAWAELPMDADQGGVDGSARWCGAMPEGLLRSLLVDGMIAGVGGVLVFLPQILILFFFILVLEESGYLPRAAFLLDRMMGGVGLSGAPSFRCCRASPARSPASWPRAPSQNPRDRLATIMIAPLMTCSARLPVYALLIGAFIPSAKVGGLNCRAWCCSGCTSPASWRLAVAWVLKRTMGKRPGTRR
jgi:ferrous iron transport protein B